MNVGMFLENDKLTMKMAKKLPFKKLVFPHKWNPFIKDHPDNHLDWIKENKIDILFNFTGYIYKQLYKYVIILGKHSSLLPAYKGILPVFWAMKNNDPVGITIFKLSQKIDCGEIILQEFCPPQRSVYRYYEYIYDRTPYLIYKSLDLLKSGKREVCNYNLKPSYYSHPTLRDLITFKKRLY